MMGIFLKELRENVKWAAVICGLLLVFVWHEIRDAESMFLFQFAQHYTLFLAPLAGLLMGVVQTLFETRPDNWAFVVHRPAGRLAIFAGKCAAGLVLLYAALAVPCLVAASWAARPGNLPIPFQGRMILPMMADVLGAGCWYFAGMLLTLRRARWWGTRVLPVGLAFGATAFVTVFVAQFWQAAVILLAVQSIGAAAAWGAFCTNGTLDAPPISRWALGAMIFPGAVGLGFVLVGMSQAFTPGAKWQYYQIDQSGNIVRVTQTVERGERTWAVTDTEGRPLPGYERIDLNDPANAERFVRFGPTLVDERFAPWPLTVVFLDDSYRAVEPGAVTLRAAAPPGVRIGSLPLYDVPRQVIDLYDPLTHMPIGTVGPAGFAPNGSTAAGQFQGKPLNLFSQGRSHVLAFESVVYWIELDRRRVRPLFHAPADDPVFSAVEIGPPASPTVVLATRRSIHVLRASGEELFSAPLEFSSQSYCFQPALLPGNSHLIFQAMPTPGHDLRRVVMEYSTDGKLLRRTEPPRLPDFRGPKLIETAIFGGIFPLGLRPLLPTWMLDEILDVRSTQYPRAFEGFMIGSALCCAVLALLLGGRCGMGVTKSIGWAATGLLLGPAGVVVLLGIHDWPAREVCAACGSKRICGRRQCTRCAAAPPAPEFDGREIFEPADVLQPVG